MEKELLRRVYKTLKSINVHLRMMLEARMANGIFLKCHLSEYSELNYYRLKADRFDLRLEAA